MSLVNLLGVIAYASLGGFLGILFIEATKFLFAWINVLFDEEPGVKCNDG